MTNARKGKNGGAPVALIDDDKAKAGVVTIPSGRRSKADSDSPASGDKIPRARFAHVSPDNTEGRRPGVYFIGVKRDEESGRMVTSSPEWLCSPLQVEALTRDAFGSEWGRLLCLIDRHGVERRWTMPMSLLARDGAEVREQLLSMGLEIDLDMNRRRRVLDFIQSAEPDRYARCVSRTGWHDGSFVTPAGTIGEPASESLVFQSAAQGDHKLSQSGSLDEWVTHVSKPCAGNSRLVLAVAAAFAAPCLHLAGQEGGGLHLRGPSSCGKSTALALAASVYGPPEYRREWRASDNGLEGVAALHCDALLPLDEIGQLDPKHAASAAYLLSNGQGKSRSRRDGTLRAPATWRVLFLSCGEVGLGDLIAEAGGKLRAGMDVRLVDVPADAGAGSGIFEQIPEDMTAGTFADALKVATAKHYGAAFPAFLHRLVTDMERAREFLREGTAALTRDLCGSDAAGQVRRVAARFALIASAGALATSYGLTGWDSDESVRAMRRCFADWLDARGGNGESEPRDMVRAVQAFIESHSEGRFSPVGRAGDDRAPRTLARAGFRADDGMGGMEHWVLPEVWRREVCKGFDPIAVARVLSKRGLLLTSTKGELQQSKRVKGSGQRLRVYQLAANILEVSP